MATVTFRYAQPTLFGEVLVRHGFKFERREILEARDSVLIATCDNPSCPRSGRKLIGKQVHTIEKYAPRQTEPDLTRWCEECFESVGTEDSTYCDGCNREVYDNDGYMAYFRIMADGNWICIACYEDETLRDGMQRKEKPYNFSDKQLSEAGYVKLATLDTANASEKEEYRAILTRLYKENEGAIIKQDSGYDDVAIWWKE